MCVTIETDEKMMLDNDIESPTADNAKNASSVEVNGGRLKKGPWTSAEDAVLVEYVTKHGVGNWNAVQKHTRLARCGKSCRLRWENHLRPDLKKGAFTNEEENLIVELHAKMGNKWARMAAELPGRTDNEIKNYWNTRIKRRQRAGLPLYPPEISLQALDESQHKNDTTTFSPGDAHSGDLMPPNNFVIPEIQFKSLELNQPLYTPPFLEISPSNGFLDIPGPHPSYTDKSVLPTMHPSKRLRVSESTFHDPSRYQSVSYLQNGQPFVYSSPYDHNIDPYYLPSSGVLNGSHAIINGNSSSLEPTWAMKQELPSLQTQAENWCSPSSPLPPLEYVDTLIQTPPTGNNLSHQLSSGNSGLLDAVLHKSHVMKDPQMNTFDFQHDSSIAVNLMDASSQLEQYGELTSALGYSSSSLFGEDTPVSGNSISELEAITGYRVREDAAIWDQTRYTTTCETKNQIFSRPDFLLASDFFDPEEDSS